MTAMDIITVVLYPPAATPGVTDPAGNLIRKQELR